MVKRAPPSNNNFIVGRSRSHRNGIGEAYIFVHQIQENASETRSMLVFGSVENAVAKLVGLDACVPYAASTTYVSLPPLLGCD